MNVFDQLELERKARRDAERVAALAIKNAGGTVRIPDSDFLLDDIVLRRRRDPSGNSEVFSVTMRPDGD